MKKFLPIILIVVVGTVIFFYLNATQNEEATIISIPDLTLESHDGDTISLKELQGTPLVINTWASWCSFCKEELKDFKVLQEELEDEVIVVAINRAESLEKTTQYTNQPGVEGSLLFLLDPADSFYREINGFSMPETIFVDSNGKIRIHKRGFMAIEEIREKTNQIL